MLPIRKSKTPDPNPKLKRPRVQLQRLARGLNDKYVQDATGFHR